LPELAESAHKTPDQLARALASGDAASVSWALDAVAGETRRQEGYDRPVNAHLLLIVDQLDELFAADVNEAQRVSFVNALSALAETGRVWIIATLRADLYERFLKQPELLALKANGVAFDLAPPGIGEIIRSPAIAAGLVYETDAKTGERLDDRLIHDVDRPDMLPLLQFTLDFLFEQRETRDGDTRLTFSAYDTLGGLAGAIDKEAERAIAPLGKEEQERLPRLLRQLAAPAPESAIGSKGALSVRSVPLKEAAYDAPAERLVRALIDARILLSEGGEQNATIRLAHQRVLESWKRAKEIAAANAEFYRIRDDVEDQFDRWQKANKSDDLLIPTGLALEEARKLVGGYAAELEPHTRTYVEASLTADDKRVRTRRFRYRLTAAAAVLFAIVAGLAGWQWQVAEHERLRAEQNLALLRNIWRELSAKSEFGHFDGDFVVEPTQDGAGVIVREPLVFVDNKGLRWEVPAGAKLSRDDSLKRSGLSDAVYSSLQIAALYIHSYYCETKERSWQDTHKMLYWAMRAAQVDETKAKMMYAATYLFGPRWGPDVDSNDKE
jgi:hypothetical protein